MGKAKRCRSVVLGAGMAVLGTAGTCPSATAANERGFGIRGLPATAANKHAKAHRRGRPSPKPTSPRGGYVYEATLGGEVSYLHPNMTCSGSTVRLTQVTLYAEGRNADALWQHNSASWNGTFTLTTGAATKITASWTPPAERQEAREEAAAHNGAILNPRLRAREDTTTASTICAATTANATIGRVGMAGVTWRLQAPVRSVAALLRQAPSNIYPNEGILAFEILPDGSVPTFSSGLTS